MAAPLTATVSQTIISVCASIEGVDLNMAESNKYSLQHAHGMVALELLADRFVVNTQGVGLADKLRSIDIPLSDMKKFCLVPTIGAQNLISRHGEDGETQYDQSYDAEFIFSYAAQGKLKKKRVFVNSKDGNFQTILKQLEAKRPDASLLELPPAEAQKQIGVMSARKGVFIIVGLLVGVPVLVALIVVLAQVFGGHK